MFCENKRVSTMSNLLIFVLIISSVMIEGRANHKPYLGCWLTVGKGDKIKEECWGQDVRVGSVDTCVVGSDKMADIGIGHDSKGCITDDNIEDPRLLDLIQEEGICTMVCSESIIDRLRSSGMNAIADWGEGLKPELRKISAEVSDGVGSQEDDLEFEIVEKKKVDIGKNKTVVEGECMPDKLSTENDFTAMSSLTDSSLIVSDPRSRVFMKFMSSSSIKGEIIMNFITDSDMIVKMGSNDECERSSYGIPIGSKNCKLRYLQYRCVDSIGGLLEVKLRSTKTGTETSLRATGDYANNMCRRAGDNIIKTWVTTTRVSSAYSQVKVCVNGTVKDIGIGSQGVNDTNCIGLFISKAVSNCYGNDRGTGATICKLTGISTRGGRNFAEVETDSKDEVIITTESGKYTSKCEKTCSVPIDDGRFVMVSCSGITDYRQIGNVVDGGCPMIHHWFSSRIAGIICRATVKPGLLWWGVVWWTLGLIISWVALVIVTWIVTLICKMIAMSKEKYSVDNRICEYCDDSIMYGDMLSNHCRCEDGVCPYCESIVGSTFELRKHVATCGRKPIALELTRQSLFRNSRVMTIFWKIRRVTGGMPATFVLYYFVFAIMFMVLIMPVSGETDAVESGEPMQSIDDHFFNTIDRAGDEDLVVSDWYRDQEMGIESCGTTCFRKGYGCECPGVEDERLSNYMFENHIEEYSPIPEGFFYPKDTFTPRSTSNVIGIDIKSSSMAGNKVIVSGTSTAEIILEPHTGITWKVTSADASESKTVTLSILEYAHRYEVVHREWFFDRTIGKETEVICVGSCSYECGEDDCYSYVLSGDRKWGCNPPGCLNFGGCTGCYAKLISWHGKAGHLFDAELVGVSLTLCITNADGKNVCKVVSDGESFTIENYEISVGRVFNIIKKLPRQIAYMYDMSRSFNIDEPDSILLNPEICEANSCHHGEVGDTTIQEVDLYDFDVKLNKSVLRKPTVKWSGVSMSRTCSTQTNVVCIYQGLVEELSDAFDNKIRVSEKLEEHFTLLGNSNGILKVRPDENSGQVSLVLKVNGLELTREEIKPVISMFKINKCEGCRACTAGFKCEISISLTSPSEFNLHIDSKMDSVSVTKSSIVATDRPTIKNVSIFTAELISSIDLYVVETGDVASIDTIKLAEPEKTLITNSRPVITITDGSGGLEDFFNSVWSAVKGLINGSWSFVKYIFSSAKTFFLWLFIFIFSIIFLNPKNWMKFRGWAEKIGKHRKVTKEEFKVIMDKKKREAKKKLSNIGKTYRNVKEKMTGYLGVKPKRMEEVMDTLDEEPEIRYWNDGKEVNKDGIEY